jgi:hypothetical protein
VIKTLVALLWVARGAISGKRQTAFDAYLIFRVWVRIIVQ